MNAEFFAAIEEIEREKGIPQAYMLDRIQQALLAAFRKDNPEYAENVMVEINEVKKSITMTVQKTVVDEEDYVEHG